MEFAWHIDGQRYLVGEVSNERLDTLLGSKDVELEALDDNLDLLVFALFSTALGIFRVRDIDLDTQFLLKLVNVGTSLANNVCGERSRDLKFGRVGFGILSK